MQNNWRLIIDSKLNGFYNMAVDEAILLNYSKQRVPTLRLYGWDQPWLTIGCNQKVNGLLKPGNNIPFVRRISGGSAILHDRELTYSLVCSLDDLDLSQKVKEAYRQLALFLKDFYSSLGLEAFFAKDYIRDSLGVYGNYCFSAWQHFDLLIFGKKIGGNAQRRRKNLIFQHGSIPQDIDFNLVKRIFKDIDGSLENTTDLDCLLKKKTDFKELREKLYLSFKRTFKLNFVQESLNESEKEKAGYLLLNKYKTDSWNLKYEKATLV